MSQSESAMAQQKKKRRPLSVTVMSGLVLTLAAVYLVRMDQAIVDWKFLASLLSFSPAYLVATGLFWGATSLVTALLLWLGWPGARRLVPIYLIAFSVYYWIDRLFLSGYPEQNINWPFSAGIDLIVIALGVWVLNRPEVRYFLEETNE